MIEPISKSLAPQMTSIHVLDLSFAIPVILVLPFLRVFPSSVFYVFINFFKELNVGVKDVRIFVGGDLVWEGVIDKVSDVLFYF